MSLFSPIYVTPLFSCSPLRCLRKYQVLPESGIATESRGVHVSVCTSCNPLTGFKQTALRPALQSLGRCQVFPVNDSQLLVVPHPVTERGFCCHLAQKRLWRDGAEPGSRVPSSWKFLLILPVVKWCTQSWGKLPWGWGSPGHDPLTRCSVGLGVSEPQSYSWCAAESVCLIMRLDFPFSPPRSPRWGWHRCSLTFLNTNIPGKQWFWEDPPLVSWIVANFRNEWHIFAKDLPSENTCEQTLSRYQVS